MSGRGRKRKIILKAVKGDYELPTWAAVFILIAGLIIFGGNYGLKNYHLYQARQAERETTVNQILLVQQEELAVIRLEIEALKKGESSAVEDRSVLVSQLEGRLAAVIKEWRPRVADIQCRWGGLFGEEVNNGSGLWLSSDNTVITSDHVAIEEDVFIGPPVRADSCSVKLPDGETITVNKEDISVRKGIEGVAILTVKNPSLSMKKIASSLNSACKDTAPFGERVVVLGYPSIGAKDDVTVTEGIISGYEDDFYITSAKIERGVSGGVAVLVNKSCYLGIPTFVRAGEVESLGRILDARVLQ